MSDLEHSILKVLAYFDLFSYPVSAGEIEFFLDHRIETKPLQQTLDQMVADRTIFFHGRFYSLQNNPFLTERRIKGNKHAEDLLVRAYKISHFLFRFPYVRGIGISGSLSKNFADENADIDFFIITSSNRLWIARTIMHMFKKLSFLVGRQHWLCMNYYIDEEALEIEEKNIFTATELITLLPVCGNGTISKFFESNDWAASYYPNYSMKKNSKTSYFNSRIKNAFEFLFNNHFGEWLDNYLMKLTAKRWKKKETEHRLNMRGVRMGIRTGKHFSKPNPEFFQKKVLGLYHNKLKEVDALQEKVSDY